MTLIQTTDTLNAFCRNLEKEPFVTLDTEFIREKTYWPHLCLIQLGGEKEAACIDPLAEGIDMTAFWNLMKNENVVKVLHSARQDIEAFFHTAGVIPRPIFDTQVAAMVLGYGDTPSYQNLVNAILKKKVDKSQRFTDWAKRPLSAKQMEYALSDVTHLRGVYLHLSALLQEKKRETWLADETALLGNSSTYVCLPEDAWKKIAPSHASPRFCAILKEVCMLRETEAQKRNKPRRHILKDDALLEITNLAPASAEELRELRGIPIDKKLVPALLEAVKRGKEAPVDDTKDRGGKEHYSDSVRTLAELLRMLLNIAAETEGVVPRMIASSEDVLKLAAGKLDEKAPLKSGWRYEIFGREAERLKNGLLRIGYDPVRRRIVLEEKQSDDRLKAAAS